MIPCSDAFGVDVFVEKYAALLAKKEKERLENSPSLISDERLKSINEMSQAIMRAISFAKRRITEKKGEN